ncbi:MAG: site-specific DNA-methyltransferase, partial [Synergistales bacterium]|nr:site-specific DNA-methyltransferase [Synergistales bacterium]
MKLYHGDCLEIMKTLEAGSVEAVVTDPPAGIAFMGKSWDRDKGGRDNWIAWMEQVARECLRLIKPGGHALVWALPRTSHWTAMAWENAGWEVRDRIAFAFGSGFPKALDVGKAIDAMAGNNPITAPSTEAAKQWDGWKSALKPAIEDWWLFRKPLDGTIAGNVLKHGVGALNVEACRVRTKVSDNPTALRRSYGYTPNKEKAKDSEARGALRDRSDPIKKAMPNPSDNLGRYPSHLIHDGSEDVVMCFPETTSGVPGIRRKEHETNAMSGRLAITGKQECGIGDSGSASRFFQCCPFEEEDFEATRLFYTAKAGKSDRN